MPESGMEAAAEAVDGEGATAKSRCWQSGRTETAADPGSTEARSSDRGSAEASSAHSNPATAEARATYSDPAAAEAAATHSHPAAAEAAAGKTTAAAETATATKTGRSCIRDQHGG
ncbi:hypothetical protein [Bradyrhizobium sp. 200]|uniref:hypothetical protein n=1 Tax=Bradyrhizobium sp. 200 TaxID=2782665 RepID=UPI0032079B0B